MGREHATRRLPLQQLLILSICRFAEPICLTSVFPYLPEMIESFGVPKNKVSKWAGITSAGFSLSQALTGIAWGRASDSFGRKPVVLIVMVCLMTTSILFGFSRTLIWAVVARSLAGAGCGNVGVIRTMVAEMVPYKELQPKAFSVMPLVWTIGSIFGPSFGGALANPASNYPEIFGGSWFFRTYPFALPNLVGATLFLVGLTVGVLFLEETLETKKDKRDYGIMLGELVLSPFRRKKSGLKWSLDEEQSAPLLKHPHSSSVGSGDPGTDDQENRKVVAIVSPPTYKEVFSRQSNLNLLTYSILALHSLAYDQLLPVFMHYPRQMDRSTDPNVRLPFKFTGGFGLDSGRIGLLFTIYGVVGVFIQFFAFPPLARYYGVLPCLKVVTVMFPIIYIITPFTALLPTPVSQQIGIIVIMVFKTWAGIFAFPCTTILLTNSAVSVRILGTLNGVAVSISAIGRAAGPAIGGFTFTVGLDKGYGILPWWILGCFGILGAITPWWLVEMQGFGDDDSGSDSDASNRISNETALQGDRGEERRSSAILIGNEPLGNSGEGCDQFGREGDRPVDSSAVSKTSNHTSEGASSGSYVGLPSTPRRERNNLVNEDNE